MNGHGDPNVDMFEDVVGDNDQQGIYEGEGLRHFERVKQDISAEGPQNKLVCHVCGKEFILTPSWEEIFYVAQNGPNQPLVLPAGWYRSNVNYDCYHSRNCGRCGEPGINIHYEPEEARRLINQAVQARFVSMGQMQQWKQQILANLRMG